MSPQERRLILVLATIQFCHIVDFMIIMPLGKTLIDAFDISPWQFNLLVAVYALSAFVSGLIAALFIDKFGRRQALVVLFAGFTLGTIACGLAPTYSTLVAARGLTGLFGGILSALVLAIVGDVFPIKRRGTAMGWVMTAFSAASVVGVPSGIALAALGGWRMPFYIIGGLSVLVLLGIPQLVPKLKGHLTKSDDPNIVPNPEGARATKTNLFAPFISVLTSRNQRAALLFSITLMLGHFTVIPNLATYMEVNVGFTVGQLSYLYGVGGLLTVVLLPTFGKLADRYGNLRIFTYATIGAVFSIFTITNLPQVGIPLALVASSSYFVVASGRNVPANTLITSVVEPQNRGSFMTIRQSINEAGLFLCSIISGAIIAEAPDGSLMHYEWVGYVAIVMSLVALWVGGRVKEVA
ncbi:MAG: MFS transporter [Bacteroidota bacterium]